MKKLALIVAFALSVLPAFAAEDFTGKWSGSFTGTDPSGSPANENMLVNFIHKGSELTGTAGPTAERQWKILNGKVDGNAVAFEVQGGGDTEGGALLKFALTFADGHLKGDVNAEQGGQKMSAKVDLTRVK